MLQSQLTFEWDEECLIAVQQEHCDQKLFNI